ncbi:hypothetical protein GTR05_004813 [Salmonella enterica]|nr:hypothetical protein [Salmonella enterica]
MPATHKCLFDYFIKNTLTGNQGLQYYLSHRPGTPARVSNERDAQMIKIRRNAFKKISSILSTAKGVISCTSWAQVDDSHETQYSVSTPEEALEWLQENQAKACVYLDGNELVICGPYYFSDSFTAYIDEAEFLAAVASLVKEDAPEGEEVTAPAADIAGKLDLARVMLKTANGYILCVRAK